MCAYLQYKENISGINFGQVREYSKASVENATKVHKREEENRNKVRKSTHRKQKRIITESMGSEIRLDKSFIQ